MWDRNKGGQEHLQNGSFDSGNSGWTVTDTNNRLNFNNGKVDVVTGGSGTSLKQAGIIQSGSPYVVIIDVVRTSSVGQVSLSVGATSQTLTTTGTYVFSLVATGGSQDFSVNPGTTWAGSINSVSVRGITVITYNFLNLPEIVSNTTEQLRYIYDASGRKLTQSRVPGHQHPEEDHGLWGRVYLPE